VRSESRNEGGQALVEFVLLFPLVLVVILFVVEFGFALHAHITVNSAAREAARHAAVARLPSAVPGTCDPDSIEERGVDSSVGLILCTEITVGYVEQNGDPVFSRGDSVVVRIDHTYNAKTPLSDLATLFSFGAIPNTFSIGACADARLEGAPSDQTILVAAAGDCGT
jgi:hypothetical protein